VDFAELKRVLAGIISVDGSPIFNDLDAFKTANPSAENLANIFTTRRAALDDSARGAAITEVTVWETDTPAHSFVRESWE